jgi:predicted Zn-dependent protease
MQVAATYFDGQSAAAHKATLQLFGDMVQLQTIGNAWQLKRDSCNLVPPVGGGNWVIEFDRVARVEFDDTEFGDAVADAFGHGRFVDFLERSWPWALGMLGVAIVGTWALLTFGVPVGAKYVATSIPPDLERSLGNESMRTLDRFLFEDSELDEEQQQRVRQLFDAITRESPNYSNYRLLFRTSESIGPNAFAIPGGVVVITDEMVELVRTDDELVSVLAHEVGHLAQRHSLRILLQNSASAIIIAGLTGDLSNITALSATIPTVLMQAKYSRDFEREADEFAFDYIDDHGFDSDALSELLLRLEEQEHDGAQQDGISTWLSSHPLSAERVPDD